MGNLGATPVLKRSWLGQDEIWFLANSRPAFGGLLHFGGRQFRFSDP
jgi:hypothetical protein